MIFINRHSIAIVLLFFLNVAHADNINHSDYMLKPTGQYGIGYQDIFLINEYICPDKFYIANTNKNDFSLANDKYCHEIALRIYYPATNIQKTYDQYYQPYMHDTINWLEKTYNLNEKEISILKTSKTIKTYTQKNAKPADNTKFPLIFFMPGSGTPCQAYTNIISNLVSNGYIVIGLNSLFINGAIELENGKVVLPPTNGYIDADGRKVNISDLKFILNNMRTIQIQQNIKNNIDWNNIGLIGHSRGAMSIVNLLSTETNKNKINAIVLLDPADMLGEKNYPLPDLHTPTLTMWSPQFKINMQGESVPNDNNIIVILKPNDAANDYSGHNNFTDSSTFQYHPAYQIRALEKLNKLNAFGLGSGDGYEIAKSINNYILIFMDKNLKSKDDINN